MSRRRVDVAQTPPEGRRGARRYALRLKLRYAVSRNRNAPVIGVGESVNLSISGLLFHSETRVYTGDAVVAALDWPLSASNSEPLYLILTGYAVRSQRLTVAISIATKGLLRASEIDSRFDALFGELRSAQAAAGGPPVD